MIKTKDATAEKSKIFNTLSNIPLHKRQKLVNETLPMLGAAKKCK